jgi:hypothetical protein
MIGLKPRWCAGSHDKTTDGLVLSQHRSWCVNAASYHLACDGYHQNSLCNLRLFPPRLVCCCPSKQTWASCRPLWSRAELSSGLVSNFAAVSANLGPAGGSISAGGTSTQPSKGEFNARLSLNRGNVLTQRLATSPAIRRAHLPRDIWGSIGSMIAVLSAE